MSMQAYDSIQYPKLIGIEESCGMILKQQTRIVIMFILRVCMYMYVCIYICMFVCFALYMYILGSWG